MAKHLARRTWAARIAMIAVLGATSCLSTCKDKGGTSQTYAKLRTFRDEMCKCRDTACAQEVSNRMSAWNAERANGGKLTLSEADTQAAQKVSDELGSCMLKALSTGSAAAIGSAAATGSAAAGSADSTPPEGAAGSAIAAGSADGAIPQECKDYKAAVERIATCEAVPQAARDTLRTSFDKASAGWQKLGSRDHLKPSCTSATQAVTAVGRQKCGWQ